ncbi:MAG: hypothetical protein MHM6MM_009539 [Cercozoa sp. M6MM]
MLAALDSVVPTSHVSLVRFSLCRTVQMYRSLLLSCWADVAGHRRACGHLGRGVSDQRRRTMCRMWNDVHRVCGLCR